MDIIPNNMTDEKYNKLKRNRERMKANGKGCLVLMVILGLFFAYLAGLADGSNF